MMRFLRIATLAGIAFAIVTPSLRAVDREAIERAIERGVKALRGLQAEDGTWPHQQIGATALAGLTLLECGVKSDDKAVVRAADTVRAVSVNLTHNYSICLSILFLDRLGDPEDIPLIESLTVRLLAGQTSTGGWGYLCPPLGDAEVRRLQTKLAARRELIGRRDPPNPGFVHRGEKDLSPEIRQQLALLKRSGTPAVSAFCDNSNTQFATLALWVGRRYGLPVDNALKRVSARFRLSQNGDGGWGYFDPSMRRGGMMTRSTASMTCAGLLRLAIADGKAAETLREHKPDAKPAGDISKSARVKRGLFALSSTVGRAAADNAKGAARAAAIPQIGGRSYYFLWSLERVAVALDLKTIGKKDWYAWGAEILVSNQPVDGLWRGSYAESGADTCFALLFLKRANLVPDLTKQLAGTVKDPGERTLKGREAIEGGATRKDGDLSSGIESKNAKNTKDGAYPAEILKDKETASSAKPTSAPAVENKPKENRTVAAEPPPSTAGNMADDLAKSTGSRFDLLVKLYREGKGADFTEALALAISQLNGDRQGKARDALFERLKRMKDTTLSQYLSDELIEIRIAAARACAFKGSKSLIPRLIPLVRDTRGGVAEAAHNALKQLSGRDFGPKPNANRDERLQAAREWLEWWNKQEGK